MTGPEATVLAVDDEPTVTEMYAMWLDDYAVETVNGGEAALEVVGEDVDAILLDRQMPGLSGDETLHRLRERGVRCPVAMVTAVTPDVDVIELGFDEYVCKPVRSEEIREVVENLLRRATYDGHLREYYALASKRAVLRKAIDADERDESEAFADLTEAFERAAERAEASRDDLLADEGFDATLRRTIRRTEDG